MFGWLLEAWSEAGDFMAISSHLLFRWFLEEVRRVGNLLFRSSHPMFEWLLEGDLFASLYTV
jgi:hypothetical protein